MMVTEGECSSSRVWQEPRGWWHAFILHCQVMMDNLRVQPDMYGSCALLTTSYMHHYGYMRPGTHADTHWVIHNSRQEVEKDVEKEESTSILRPSTIVPFSFSRARSASVLVSKVTNPKPWERHVRQEKGWTHIHTEERGQGGEKGRETEVRRQEQQQVVSSQIN